MKPNRFIRMLQMLESHLPMLGTSDHGVPAARDEANILTWRKTFRPTPHIELIVTRHDGTLAENRVNEHSPSLYDAILVDAPCSADRSWIFNRLDSSALPRRLEEYRLLPDLHARLLDNALRLLRPGGVVVYATCTLDRAQNEDVVRRCLSSDEARDRYRLLDLNALARHTDCMFAYRHRFVDDNDGDESNRSEPDWGITIVPVEGKSRGPMFLSAIQKCH